MRELWRVPRLWPGETVAVLATGPSLTQARVDYCRGRARVIAVNDAYRLAPWADMLYACDRRWWAQHEATKEFAGLKVTGWQQGSGPQPTERADVKVLLLDGKAGYHYDPGVLRHGSNSTHQAVQLAAHAGAAKIVLLGCDMRIMPNGKKHFFGDHPKALNQGINFDLFIEKFEALAPSIAEAGIEVINTVADSALRCFPFQPLEEALV